MSSVGRAVIPPLHRPLDPDDSPEFHAARLLLLLSICGEQTPTGPRITGTTKLAKLDFFVRYPKFLARALEHRYSIAIGEQVLKDSLPGEVEAPMIRYRYGPWDPRYRAFIAFLETRRLVSVSHGTSTDKYTLTKRGVALASMLSTQPEFMGMVRRCQVVSSTLSSLAGTELKNLIYELFPKEVGELTMRETITP
jgi:hypothetical protein